MKKHSKISMPNKRTKERVFPFIFDGWDEAGGNYGDIQFSNVEFIEDFGPIKKGSKFDCVMIEHCEAKLVAITYGPMDEETGFAPQVGEVVVNYKAIPVK
jgi:hypothetical protein